MKFLSALLKGDELFLGFLGSRISEEEFTKFLIEEEFVFENELPKANIREILSRKKFPVTNLRAYGWLIYEISTGRLSTFNCPMRIFASSIYIYVRHIEEWGGGWQGEYCYLMIADSIKRGDEKELRSLIIFFEWLCTFTVAANPRNDYPLLVSWLLVKCRLDEVQEDFVRIVENHLKHRIEDQYLLVGDSYGFGVDDWLGLVETIPDVAGLDRDLLWDLICRSDLQG